jgi:hypothetical protein
LWDHHAASFSDFAFARIFDQSLGAEGVRREVYLPGLILGEELRTLRAVFQAAPATRDDLGQFSYRFARPGQRYSVTVHGPERRSLLWQMWASDAAAFRALVGELGSVCPVLEGVRSGDGPLYLQTGTAAELELRQSDCPF